MLAGLRLDTLVGGNDQQNQVNPAHPSQHVADEALVAGDIYKPESQPFAVRPRQFEMRESQVNRYSSPLFFFQAVGVNPGQGLDQRGFSVINVPSGANDD